MLQSSCLNIEAFRQNFGTIVQVVTDNLAGVCGVGMPGGGVTCIFVYS